MYRRQFGKASASFMEKLFRINNFSVGLLNYETNKIARNFL